jgi:hypothetical protein
MREFCSNRNTETPKHRSTGAFGAWNLEFVWNLEFGVWSFEHGQVFAQFDLLREVRAVLKKYQRFVL